MIGTDTLLYPEAGDGFLAALQTAILYSDRVRVLTVNNPEFVDRELRGLEGIGAEHPVFAQRLKAYFSSLKDSLAHLDILAREGLVMPLRLAAEKELETFDSWNQDSVALITGLDDKYERSWLKTMDVVDQAFNLPAACLSDLATGATLFSAIQKKKISSWSLERKERLANYLFFQYLLMLSVVAEREGVVPFSWLPEFQKATLRVRQLFEESGQLKPSIPGNHQYIDRRLSAMVLTRFLPRGDDLPLDELLRIREKRYSELESFRVALRKLSSQIDPNTPVAELEAVLRVLVDSTIEPAVDELRRSLVASRLESIRKLGRSSSALASAAFSASITLVAGAPLDLAAALGAVGGLLGGLFDAVLDERKLLNASQWGVLVRLRKRRGRRQT